MLEYDVIQQLQGHYYLRQVIVMRRIFAKLSPKNRVRDKGESSQPALPVREISTIDHDQQDINSSSGRQLGLFRIDQSPPNIRLGEESYNVDIIAIHGLDGDAKKTWTHDNGTFWLRDLLPEAMPGARIFSYGYPSEVFFTRSVAGIRDFAMQLLMWLASERFNNAVDTRRPIIFICHSLGGIVFKEAMIIAVDRFRDIWLSSKGVVFMGTPHRGSPSANLAKMLGSIANLAFHMGPFGFGRGVRTTLLRDLEQNSRELLRIADDFTQRSSVFRITTFYETDHIPPLKEVIVAQSSAVIGLPNEQCAPLSANHRELCRFEGEPDANYKLVVQHLQRTVREIILEIGQRTTSLSTGKSYDEVEKACVSALNSVDMGSYEFEIAQPAKGTLHWLLSKPEYVRWKEGKSSSLLWITGYIGCGKTTIALYISNVLVSLRQPYGIICRYFCDEREKSHDASALLRALIFQIVTCHRRFLKIVKKALDRGGIHILRQVDTLWDIFAQIACDNKVASISVIIDGIEGYERRTQAMLVGRISELLRSDKAANVKFLITSRPNLAALRSIDASSAQVILLRLEDEQEMIGKDVNLFIHQQLQVLVDRDGCTPATRDILEEVLVSKADRTFLWISLVLPLLEERFVVATDIQSVTDLLPLDLTLAYERLLYLIPSSDRKMVGRLLCLIAVSARPLSGDELSILLAILMGHRTALALQDDQLPMDNRMICAALGPLIRVCGSKISFVHPSLTKYLISLSSSTHSLSTSFGIDVQRDTMELVTACMHYLSLDEFKDDLFQRSESSDDDSPSSDAFEGPVLDEDSLFIFDLYREPMFRDKQEMYLEASIQIAKRYKLFDYASLHWATDFLRCDGSASLEASEVASLLCGYDEARLTNWLRYFWIAKGFTEPCLPADPLIVACYFGHSDTLYQYLDSSQDDQDEIISACLFWSAREGHTSCVQAILRHSTSIPMHGISPLSVAAQYGHVDTVLALIQDGRFDLNAPGDTGRTALSLASENGHCDVVALLLSHKAIDVNLPGKYKYTAVFWAVLAMSFRTFTHFLTDKRVDLNHLDEQGRTLLSLAAEQGAVDIVRSLVRSTRVRIENRDVKGRTPISYAAQYGHLEVVIILLTKQQTQASVQDNTGRNAHSWAASQPNSDVLHKLLTFDPKGADVEDSSGWPALAWAMKPPGYPDNVTELVHSLEVNINRKDKVNSRTPLSWAASYGFFSIAHTLSVSSGILLDLEDASGRTPLSHASSNGNINVVALLLSRDGVNINSTDHNGCTPLSWAAREGSCEVILFLLSHPRIDCSIRDVLGRSPRDIALEFGHEKAADIIQATSKTM